jgi:hypothetical protein
VDGIRVLVLVFHAQLLVNLIQVVAVEVLVLVVIMELQVVKE